MTVVPGLVSRTRQVLSAFGCNVAALWVASEFVDGIDYERFWHLIVAGLVFAIVNALVKPIVTLLALPAIILTLGIAYFFVNLLMLYVTSWITPGFKVDGFWHAVLGTIIIWAVNWALHLAFGMDRKRR